jgi:hypothetical protein
MNSETFAFQSTDAGGAACAKHVMKTALTRSQHLRMGEAPPKIDFAIECRE